MSRLHLIYNSLNKESLLGMLQSALLRFFQKTACGLSAEEKVLLKPLCLERQVCVVLLARLVWTEDGPFGLN